MAEDEESCLETDEYKFKGVIKESANFMCQSKFHNERSEAVTAIIYDADDYIFLYNQTVINSSTIVNIFATRCDGIVECFDDQDEKFCGLNLNWTILIGILTFYAKYKYIVQNSSLQLNSSLPKKMYWHFTDFESTFFISLPITFLYEFSTEVIFLKSSKAN